MKRGANIASVAVVKSRGFKPDIFVLLLFMQEDREKRDEGEEETEILAEGN